MTQVVLQPAYVLHHRPYRDSSLLLELLTHGNGRLGVVARGARRPKSSWRGLLQPFTPLLISYSLRGELGTLTGAEADGARRSLPPDRLLDGYYLNELLLRLVTRFDACPDVYREYACALAALAAGEHETRTLRLFEKRLLDALGYGLNLSHDALDGEPLQAQRSYVYRLERGPVAMDVAEGALCFSGQSLLALGSETLEESSSLADARRLLRAALDLYTGQKPLRTRELLLATRRRRSASRVAKAGES